MFTSSDSKNLVTDADPRLEKRARGGLDMFSQLGFARFAASRSSDSCLMRPEKCPRAGRDSCLSDDLHQPSPYHQKTEREVSALWQCRPVGHAATGLFGPDLSVTQPVKRLRYLLHHPPGKDSRRAPKRILQASLCGGGS